MILFSVCVYLIQLAGTPFAGHLRLPLPDRPAVPFKPDKAVLYRIREKYMSNPAPGWETELS